MASLQNVKVKDSYTSLLKLSGNTDTIVDSSGSAIQVVDGDGTASPLYLNTDRIGLNTNNPDSPFTITDTGSGNTVTLNHSTSPTGSSSTGAHIYFRSGSATLGSSTLRGWIGYYDNANEGAGTRLNIRGYAGTYIGGTGSTTDGLTVDSSNNVGIGTISPADDMDIADSNDYVQLNLDCFSTTNTHHGTLVFKKSSNATIGTRASTDDGEALGFIGFNGTNTSSASARGAYIYVTQNGSAGSSTVPAKMTFSTSSNSAAVTNMILDENSRISLSNNDGGANNTTIFGYLAGNNSGSGATQNCYIGHESGKANVYGDDNVLIGFQSGLALGASSGSVQNSLVGSLSGSVITDGDYNTFLGYRTGSTGTNDITTGTFNTFIGKGVAGSSASATNQTAIGADVTAQGDNTVTLGNADVTDVYMSQDSQAYVHAQNVPNHVANTMSSPYYRFDGVNDEIAIADNNHMSFGDGTTDNPFSISAWIYMEDATSFSFIHKGTFNSDAEWNFWTQGDDKLYFVLYDESESSTFEGVFTSELTSYENQWIHLVGTYNGVGGSSALSGLKIYINGVLQSTTGVEGGTYVAMENLGDEVRIGNLNDSTYGQGSIACLRIWNKELTTSEIKDDYSGASVPFKYKGANQTNLTSGTLVKGKAYRITTYNSNDDFTNLGASSNATGVEFVSTGTTPTEWLHSSVLVPIGAVAEYDGSSAGEKVWGDKSGNDLHGTVSGATLENTPYDSGTEYEEGYFEPSFGDSDGNNQHTLNSSYKTLRYVKIGNVVHLQGYVAIGTDNTSASGNVTMSLPYNSIDGTGLSGRSIGTANFVNVDTATGEVFNISVTDGASRATFIATVDDNARHSLDDADLNAGSSGGGLSEFWIQITYITG